jgi:hypothetical protein
MSPCPGCGKDRDGSFCPYCGAEAEPPELALEVRRDRFVVGQRCLLRFRLRSDRPAEARIRASIERLSMEETSKDVRLAGAPAVVSFGFEPRAAGEFRVRELRVSSGEWAWTPGEDELTVRVSSSETDGGGIVYNIDVSENYGSDVTVQAVPSAPREPEWQPIRLARDTRGPSALKLLSPPHKIFVFAKPEVRFGRRREADVNDLVLRLLPGPSEADARISRHHGRFLLQDGRPAAVDARSTYGLSLDGRRLPPGQPVPLPDAGTLDVGGALSMEFRVSGPSVRLTRVSNAPQHLYVLLFGPATVELPGGPASFELRDGRISMNGRALAPGSSAGPWRVETVESEDFKSI